MSVGKTQSRSRHLGLNELKGYFNMYNFCRGYRGFFQGKGQAKGKEHLTAGHEGPKGKLRYSSTLSLTSALNAGGWSMPRSSRLTPPPGITRYPLYRRLGGPHGRSARVGEISTPPGFDPRTVQPVANRYTDYTLTIHFFLSNL